MIVSVHSLAPKAEHKKNNSRGSELPFSLELYGTS